MNLRLRKSAATLALVLSAGFTLAACGGDDAGAGGSGDTSSVGEDAGTELTKENFFTEVTKAQQQAGTSHLEMAFGVGGQEVTASGDVSVGETPTDSAMSLTMDLGGQGGIEMRLVDGVLYLNMGPMSQNKFAKVDLTDPDDPIGQQFGGLLDTVDPSKQLEQLQDSITGFEQEGEAKELDGVDALPYVVTVDSSAIAEQLGAAGAGAQAQVPEELVYTMWVGPDNLPRRISMDVAGTAMTLDYSKWGEDVSIEAPPADQVTEQDLSQFGA